MLGNKYIYFFYYKLVFLQVKKNPNNNQTYFFVPSVFPSYYRVLVCQPPPTRQGWCSRKAERSGWSDAAQCYPETKQGQILIQKYYNITNNINTKILTILGLI